MTDIIRPAGGIAGRFWTRSRLFACGAAAFVMVLFMGANAHLIAVSFMSRPDCVLQPAREGVAVYSAAKPSC